MNTTKPMLWQGVIPAITTPFLADLSVDHEFFAKHCNWLIDHGCKGVVALGSLGEGATLTSTEKSEILRTAVAAIGERAVVVSGISSLSTAEAVALAKDAEAAGCNGLMVLPPYIYKSDWREMKAHVKAVIEATPLSCMLYNNPVAYGTDFVPEQVMELMEECPNLHAIKESSTDVRRVLGLRCLAGDRLQILCGVDDAIVEAVYAGATGWIAGLVNAFPMESVALFDAAMRGDKERAYEIYRWFLPLLRMDTVVKFVQLIKLVQERVGMGNQLVRGPRLVLSGAELEAAEKTIADSLASHPWK